jgi:transposase-like protein
LFRNACNTALPFSSVAITHGINANVIRKWLLAYRDQSEAALPAFVPLRASPKWSAEALDA